MPRAPLPHAFLNGAFIAAAAARVSAFDRGFLFGDGVYEVIPVYGGRPFHVDHHLERLQHSLDGIELDTPWDDGWWTERIGSLVAQNGGGEQAVYLQVTRGAESGRDHRFPSPPVEPTVFMYSTATPPRDPAVDRDGLTAISAVDFRWARCDLKAVSLLANVLLKNQATAAGADEVILHRDGRLTEASVSNAFVVHDGRAATPPLSEQLLPGVTRSVTLGLCSDLGIPVDERPLTLDDLDTADEVWVTSSSREIAPVVALDGKPVGSGAPGPLYARVRRAFDDAIEQWRR